MSVEVAVVVIVAWILAVFVGETVGSRREVGSLGGVLGALLLSWLGVFLIVLLSPLKKTAWLCPRCREEVKKDARVCRHCGKHFKSFASGRE